MQTVQIINISGSTFACIVMLIIGLLAFPKMRQSKGGATKIKALFVLSFCLGVLATSTFAIMYAFFMNDDYAVNGYVTMISAVFWASFFLTLLGTLVMRLHITFKGSALKMTRNTVYFFKILFVIESILSIVFTIGCAPGINLHRAIFSLSFGLFFIFYLIGSASAVRLFVANLSELTRLQSGSQRKVSDSPKDIALNAKQQRTLHLSSRYILLFLVAILSTILAVLSVQTWHNLLALFWSIDLCVNLWCLYLQFAFAANHYRKCCGCLDTCCTSMVAGSARRSIHRDSLRSRVPMTSGSVSVSTGVV